MSETEFMERAMACAQRLWRIAYLILRNEVDCDDAVQDALIRAWSRLDTLKNTEWFETWLVRILINAARTMRRRKPDQPLPDAAFLPAAALPNSDLRDAIRDLEWKLRLPLVLHHLEGYSIDECAQMLHLPASTVKWRLRAARKKLGDALREE